jgi:hypothetical protein
MIILLLYISLINLNNLQSNFLTVTSGRAVTQYILVLRLVKTGIVYEKQYLINFIYFILFPFPASKRKKSPCDLFNIAICPVLKVTINIYCF